MPKPTEFLVPHSKGDSKTLTEMTVSENTTMLMKFNGWSYSQVDYDAKNVSTKEVYAKCPGDDKSGGEFSKRQFLSVQDASGNTFCIIVQKRPRVNFEHYIYSPKPLLDGQQPSKETVPDGSRNVLNWFSHSSGTTTVTPEARALAELHLFAWARCTISGGGKRKMKVFYAKGTDSYEDEPRYWIETPAMNDLWLSCADAQGGCMTARRIYLPDDKSKFGLQKDDDYCVLTVAPGVDVGLMVALYNTCWRAKDPVWDEAPQALV